MTRAALAAALGFGILLNAGAASAYCRTTTCDVDYAAEGCTWDPAGCATHGFPLFWPDSCGWFGVQKDGSARRSISYETLHATVMNALSIWSKANCGGGRTPSFEMQDTDLLYGPIECQAYEFNKKAANASAWTFRDDSWPYTGTTTTFALTTLSVSLSTGKILDADVELNSFGANITTSDVNAGADLASIVLHEAGHFLGLAHADAPSAIMLPRYSPGTIARSLSPDDETGICAVYPPGKPPECGEPEPIYGFSKYCDGIDPSTEPTTPGAGGTPSGNPSTPPEASDAGDPKGDVATPVTPPRLPRDDGCGVARGAPAHPAGLPLGAALVSLALRRRFRNRRRPTTRGLRP